MSDTSENQPTAGKPEEVRDEVRLDLDEDALDKWEQVRGDYVVDPESEVAHPALTESEDDDEDDLAAPSDDGEEDDEADDDEARDEEE